MNERATLNAGTDVWSRDGELLGTVEQVLGDYFQLRPTEGGRQHWFPLASVETGGSRATVDFEHGDVLASSVPAPDAYEQSQYIEADERSDEQEAQREHLLHDLADQRQKLHSEGALPDADRTVGEPVEQELGEMEREAEAATGTVQRSELE
jgi:hypothetical protein